MRSWHWGSLLSCPVIDLDFEFSEIHSIGLPSVSDTVPVRGPGGIVLLAILRNEFLRCSTLRRDQVDLPRLSRFRPDEGNLLTVRRPSWKSRIERAKSKLRF